MPLVSVVIPAYNAEKFIARTLHSVQQQTFSDLEIIVVDDGSTDATLSIVRRLSQKYSRLRVISKPNEGVAAARNCGISAGRGRYVAFIDADDLWHPTKIERQLREMSAGSGGESIHGVYALYRIIDENDRVIGHGPYWAIKGSCLSQHIVMHPVGNGSSLLVLRSAALAVGGFDPNYARMGAGGAEDLDFELKFAARYRMSGVPEYLVGYRTHPENMSSNRRRMARAMELTVRRHVEENPDLSANCVKWSLSRLAVYQLFCYLQVPGMDNVLRTGWRLLRDDLAFGLQEVSWRFALRALRQRTRRRPIPFYELSPTHIPRKWHRPQTRKRLMALAREDAARPVFDVPRERTDPPGYVSGVS